MLTAAYIVAMLAAPVVAVLWIASLIRPPRATGSIRRCRACQSANVEKRVYDDGTRATRYWHCRRCLSDNA